MIGWPIHSHRQGVRATRMMPTATSTAQPKCSDGMAANWLATESCWGAVAYTFGPYIAAVSTNPRPCSIRAGASGNAAWISSAKPVSMAIEVRIRVYCSRDLMNIQTKNPAVSGKWTVK